MKFFMLPIALFAWVIVPPVNLAILRLFMRRWRGEKPMIAQNVLRVFGHLILAIAVLASAFLLFVASQAPGGASLMGLAASVGVLLLGAVIASLFLAIAVALERLEVIEGEAKKQTERLEYLAQVQYEALGVLKENR